jgi:Tfp pilus assembly protein PilF
MAAEQALVRALKTDPGRPAIYLQLAHTYARTARKLEADRSVAMALRLGVPPALAEMARRGELPG